MRARAFGRTELEYNFRMRVLRKFGLICSLVPLGLIAGCDGDASAPVERAANVNGNGLNVLMIVVDDLNTFVSHLGTYPGTQTPNIDRIAAAGTSFSAAYASAPACNPSRTAVLTGKRPYKTGLYRNPENELGVLRAHDLIPQRLARNGYLTLATGKLMHKIEDNSEFFERVYTAAGSYDSDMRLNGIDSLGNNFDWGGIAVEDDATPDFDRVNWAVEQLQQDHDAPFFLGVGIVRPHLPWIVPQKYFDQFPLKDIVLPPGYLAGDIDDLPHGADKEGITGDHEKIVAAGKWEEGIQAYLASVAYADAAIGRLWDALQASAYKDNTVVILWGDHGWQFGEKERWRKFTLWSAGSQTTFIMVTPGDRPAGQVCDKPVDLMSIYPTILDLLNLEQSATDPSVDGVSVVPLLDDCGIEWTAPALATNKRNNHAIRLDNWSYLRHANGDEELYDRANDPWELHNLAADPSTAAVREDLSELLPCHRYPVIGTLGCNKDD